MFFCLLHEASRIVQAAVKGASSLIPFNLRLFLIRPMGTMARTLSLEDLLEERGGTGIRELPGKPSRPS